MAEKASLAIGPTAKALRREVVSSPQPARREAPLAEPKPLANGGADGAVSELLLTPRVLDGKGYDQLASQLTGLIEEAKSQAQHLQGLADSLVDAGQKLEQTQSQAHGKIALGRRVWRQLDEQLLQAETISKGLTAAVEAADRVGQMVEGLQENYDLIEQQQQERLETQRERYERAVQTLRRVHIAEMRTLRAEMAAETAQIRAESEKLQQDIAESLRAMRLDFQKQAEVLRREQGSLLADLEEQIEAVRGETAEAVQEAERQVLRITAEAVDSAEAAARGIEERLSGVKLASDATRRSLAALKRLVADNEEPPKPAKAAKKSPRSKK